MKKQKKIRSLAMFGFIALATIALTASCEEDGIDEGEGQAQYYRESQLRNTFTNGIAPLNTEFITATTNLREAITTFAETRTLDNLENSRAVWLETLIIWKQLELYNVGDVQDSFVSFQINFWPTDTERVDDFIDGDASISESFISNLGSSSKGISAIEYLLYAEDTDTETLATFTTDINAERRTQYLMGLTEDLMAKANEFNDLWIAFAPTFNTSLENGLRGSQNQLANAMITLAEEIVINKLGNALGDRSGGIIDITALENYKSNVSLTSIEQNLIALQTAYTGSFRQDVIMWGFDDFLELVTATELNTTIQNSFTSNLALIRSFNGSLESNLISNPEAVVALQSSLNELEILIKVDMANALGATVTVNSNDGD